MYSTSWNMQLKKVICFTAGGPPLENISPALLFPASEHVNSALTNDGFAFQVFLSKVHQVGLKYGVLIHGK